MKKNDVVIIGSGFTGLTAGYILSSQGKKVTIIEADSEPGGLAGMFSFNDGTKVEKFYHHWFNNDVHVPQLLKDLNVEKDIMTLPTQTSMFYNGRTWKLSTPIDLLKFKAISFVDRIRLGLVILKIRRLKDWKIIEHLSIREWLEPLCGPSVYKIVWEPLVKSKFSIFSESVNAVWMWKKLVLRGSTRNKAGKEELAYFKGGFGRLVKKLEEKIKSNGGEIIFNCHIDGVEIKNGNVLAVINNNKKIKGEKFLFTPSFPIIANIFKDVGHDQWIKSLLKVKYLGNICLVLRLKKSLSKTYWLNVNDPSFPFVGVIEHTNFDDPKNYGGTHIVYLSRYISTKDKAWEYSDREYYDYAMRHLYRMFPNMKEKWVIDYKIWRSEYSQPVTEKKYSEFVPSHLTPFKNTIISTMAQIYPEDRGTNYAIREGRLAAATLINLDKKI